MISAAAAAVGRAVFAVWEPPGSQLPGGGQAHKSFMTMMMAMIKMIGLWRTPATTNRTTAAAAAATPLTIRGGNGQQYVLWVHMRLCNSFFFLLKTRGEESRRDASMREPLPRRQLIASFNGRRKGGWRQIHCNARRNKPFVQLSE